ncbi:uncharacterized protein [Spinacia oleracea]|uniref:Uncharacterized protein n=1 Tax=Spinacia oleracea TaxID=3562 RepID=A0ABM3QQC4_SPIOL|nr:uncharacterized protein LOC130461473 [Spinacia oleracea]
MEEVIRRTVYVSYIDQHVTEEQLIGLSSTMDSIFMERFFQSSGLGFGQSFGMIRAGRSDYMGRVVDCRVCGYPKFVLRFGFVEFTNEVLPSKTAIAIVNPTVFPQIFNPLGKLSLIIYLCAAAKLFSAYIVYGTHNLIKRYSYDGYILAAVTLYLDIVNLFLALLAQLFSRKRYSYCIHVSLFRYSISVVDRLFYLVQDTLGIDK